MLVMAKKGKCLRVHTGTQGMPLAWGTMYYTVNVTRVWRWTREANPGRLS